MIPLRPILFSLLGLAFSLALWRLYVDSASALDALRHWRRRPAEIWGFPTNRTVGAMLDRDNHTVVPVTVTPLSFYRDYQPITLLEHPTQPEQRRILHPIDLSFAPLVWLLALGLTFWSFRFVSQLPLGADFLWTSTGWAQQPSPLPPLHTTLLDIYQPRDASKATLLFSLLLGLPLFLGGLWAFRTNILTGVLLTFAAAFLFGFLLVAFGESLTQTIRANHDLVETRSLFGRRRFAWRDIASVDLDDVGKRMRETDRQLSRGGSSNQSRLLPFRPDIKMWRLKDASGKEILAIDEQSIPSRALADFIARARLQAH